MRLFTAIVGGRSHAATVARQRLRFTASLQRAWAPRTRRSADVDPHGAGPVRGPRARTCRRLRRGAWRRPARRRTTPCRPPLAALKAHRHRRRKLARVSALLRRDRLAGSHAQRRRQPTTPGRAHSRVRPSALSCWRSERGHPACGWPSAADTHCECGAGAERARRGGGLLQEPAESRFRPGRDRPHLSICPDSAPLILFALGRTAGWIAHAIEQYAAAIAHSRARAMRGRPPEAAESGHTLCR